VDVDVCYAMLRLRLSKDVDLKELKKKMGVWFKIAKHLWV